MSDPQPAHAATPVVAQPEGLRLRQVIDRLRLLGADAQTGTTPNLAERIWDAADELSILLPTFAAVQRDLQHVLDTCVPAEELRPPVVAQEEKRYEPKWPLTWREEALKLEAQVSTLQAALDKATARAVMAEQHKVLSRLGKSSWQEVVEEKLRVELAETQLRAEAAEAQLHAVQQILQEMDVYANGLIGDDGQFAGGEHYAVTFWRDKLRSALPKE